MIRKPTAKLRPTALPSRAEVAAALAALGLLTSATAHAWEGEAGAPPASSAPAEEEPLGGGPQGEVPEGLLIVLQLPQEVSLYLGDELLPREELDTGIALPPGPVELRFHWACGQDTMHTALITDGGVTQLDALAIVKPPDIGPTGGVPPDDRFTIHGGCCGGGEQAANHPSRTGGTAGFALVVALIGARRRRR